MTDLAPLSTPGRVLPHSHDAEQQLLGAIMTTPRAYEDVADFLRPEHFADPTHGRIFEACAKLIDQGRSADPVALRAIFERDGGLAEIGGWDYLAVLPGAVVSTRLAGEHGRMVLDLARRRDLIARARELEEAAYDITADVSADQVQERHEAALFEATTGATTTDRSVSLGEAVTRALDTADAARKARASGKMVGLTTGLADLDRQTGGLRRSDLVILAGRPSMGKTSLAYCIAYGAAKAGHRALFCSLEMSAEQLATRGLAIESGVSSSRIERGETDHQEFERAYMGGNALRDLPLIIDDTPAITPTMLRTHARRLKRRGGLDLVVVDYLQLMRWSERVENRTQEVSKITGALKAIAKELDVPVLALSQLSRSLEAREDKRPQLSDLRESGSIEQDADLVMFVYRDEYYAEREEPQPDAPKFDAKWAAWTERMRRCKGIADVIVAKQRRGPIGTVHLAFQADLTKFSDLYHPEEGGF
jgi:replicative DNA helicase